MKFGLFTDVHYTLKPHENSPRRQTLGMQRIREAFAAFEKAGVDAVLCTGDLVDYNYDRAMTRGFFDEALSFIRSAGLKFIFVPGNHDYAELRAQDFIARGLPLPPYTVDFPGLRIVALDSNFDAKGNRSDQSDAPWYETKLPDWELEFLKKTLDETPDRAIVMLHQDLDDAVEQRHILFNAADARRIIEESGKVPLVIEGHYHSGADHVIGGVRYLTQQAMCDGDENHFTIIDTDEI